MQNVNRMKPINVTKQPEPSLLNKNVNQIQAVYSTSQPQPQQNIKRPNKNLLDKYSFQDNELSKSQADFSIDKSLLLKKKENDFDWLQLSVKQITLFSRQLIVIFYYFIRQTFYLQIKYKVNYAERTSEQSQLPKRIQSRQSKPYNKNLLTDKIQQNQFYAEYLKEVRYVKSKLVHGSILQNQGKHLILNLKAKDFSNEQMLNEGLKLPRLKQLQFCLFRVVQTSKQGKIMCRQVISNPLPNKQYSIDFWEQKIDYLQKQKPIGTMLFELFPAIEEQPLANQNYDLQSQDFDDQEEIQEDISQNVNTGRGKFQNYTLGAPQIQPTKQSKNIFDDQQEQEISQIEPNSQRSQFNNQSQSKTQRFKYQSEVSEINQKESVFKMNEMSRLMDNDLSRSKNQGYLQRQYFPDNTQFLDDMSVNKNSRSKDLKKPNTSASNNDTNLSKTKPQHYIKTQNDYTYVQDDTQQRFQGNTTTNQRDHYTSTLEYSKYVNDQIVLNGSKISPIVPNTPKDNFKKTSENKVKQVSKINTPKFERHEVKLDQNQVKPSQNLPKRDGKTPNKVSPYSQRMQNGDEQLSQNNSQWLTQNLPDLDSSNIRYKFDDNDISNIEETKNMQQLISQIEKIEKQWYQKRVLNRNLKQKISNEFESSSFKINQDSMKEKLPQSRINDNPNNVIDLELRKFKIKLDEGTFYNKLIENLKNKYNVNETLKLAQNKLSKSRTNSKGSQIINNQPKDFIVYLIANEVDEQSMSSPGSQVSQKIEIKIPSQRISDLIQAQKSQSQSIQKDKQKKQKFPQFQTKNSEDIRKNIIKDFQKQLYSKVMKVKLIDDKKQKQSLIDKILPFNKNKDQPNKKTKTKIIQITLQEQQFLTNKLGQKVKQALTQNKDDNQNKILLNNQMINDNRISLIGMYPLPIPRSQNRGSENSFYQNISNQSLGIAMYNTKTGNQQGKLNFQLKKGKVDKQIQTFQPLQDLDGNQLTKKRSKSQLHPYHYLYSQNPYKTDTKTPVKRIQSSLQKSKINSRQKSPVKQFKIDLNLQSKLSPEKKSETQIKRLVSKSRLQKQLQEKQKVDFQLTGKIVKNIGQQSSPRRQKNNKTNKNDGKRSKLSNGKNYENILDNISVKLPQSQRMFPVLKPEEQNRNFQSPTQVRNPLNSKASRNSNKIKTQRQLENDKPTIKSRMKTEHNDRQEGPSSYRLMKKQLEQTAGMLENLKLKAQDFINKIQREKVSRNRIQRQFETSSMKEKSKQLDDGQEEDFKNNQRRRKVSNLGMKSSVISQTVMQRKKSPIKREVSKDQLPQRYDNQSQSYQKSQNQQLDTPYISQYNSVNSKIYKQKTKKPSFHLKQASEYHFQSLSPNQKSKGGSRQKNYSPVKGRSSPNQNSKKLFAVEFYSMKIKVLSVNNGTQTKKTPLYKLTDNQDYFVKIFTGANQQKSKQTLISSQESPFIRRCYKSPESSDDNLYVEFPTRKSKNFKNQQTLLLEGKQSSKIFIELYNSLHDHLHQQVKRNYRLYLNEDENMIDLVTASPKINKASQPVGVLAVTFLELLAQNSFQYGSEQNASYNKSAIINYSNFLYDGDNIIGKININYSLVQNLKNENEIKQILSKNLSGQKKSRNNQENISNLTTSKNTNQIRLRNNILERQHQNSSLVYKDYQNGIRKLRSQSGMTKKLSPRRKLSKPVKIQYPSKNDQESRLVDPLEILKRKGPKPFRTQEKTKSYSHSHDVRKNKPFQTPTSLKRAKNQFQSLNSSSSLHFRRQKTADHNINKKNNSGFSSGHVEIMRPGKLLETPQSSKAQLISPKKDSLSQIRRKKNTKQLKSYHIQSRIYPTEQTRFTQNRRYDGGNIKFGKSSRFNIVDSPDMAEHSDKAKFPGPGHYQVKSMFDRHTVKEP